MGLEAYVAATTVRNRMIAPAFDDCMLSLSAKFTFGCKNKQQQQKEEKNEQFLLCSALHEKIWDFYFYKIDVHVCI